MKILFLCTANSCRSQMAEGWGKRLLAGRAEVHSAGVSPVTVNPLAVRVMGEAGVDISEYRSKHVDEFQNERFDLAVTLCDYAGAVCPNPGNAARVLHVPFDDPLLASGVEEEILDCFRAVRDQIRDFVAGLPEEFETFSRAGDS